MKKVTLLILLSVLFFSCPTKKCTKKALRSVYYSNYNKSLKSKNNIHDVIVNSKENPKIQDFYNMAWFVAPSEYLQINDTYSVWFWISSKDDVELIGQTMTIRGSNCIINGDLKGHGKLVIESHQPGKNYNFNTYSKLIVKGEVDERIEIVLNDNATKEIQGGTLSDGGGSTSQPEIVEVECTVKLPFVRRDPITGTNYWYESLKK